MTNVVLMKKDVECCADEKRTESCADEKRC